MFCSPFDLPISRAQKRGLIHRLTNEEQLWIPIGNMAILRRYVDEGFGRQAHNEILKILKDEPDASTIYPLIRNLPELKQLFPGNDYNKIVDAISTNAPATWGYHLSSFAEESSFCKIETTQNQLRTSGEKFDKEKSERMIPWDTAHPSSEKISRISCASTHGCC